MATYILIKKDVQEISHALNFHFEKYRSHTQEIAMIKNK